MYKLFIVDDEKLVVEGLRDHIDWNQYQIEISGVATDGKTALKLIIERKPDIIITDIRMPGLNGLELIQKVKEVHPDTVFLIISGYTEFNYAKKAIELEAIDYLIKPIEIEEIVASVHKAIDKHQMKRNQKKNIRSEIADLLFRHQNVEFPEEKLEGHHFTVIVGESIIDKSLGNWVNDVDVNSIEDQLNQVFTEDGFKVMVFIDRERLVLLLIGLDPWKKPTTGLVQHNLIVAEQLLLRNEQNSTVKLSKMIYGIGSICAKPSEVFTSRMHAADALKLAVFLGKFAIQYDDVIFFQQTNDAAVREVLEKHLNSDSFRIEALPDIISQLINDVTEHGLTPKQLKEICFCIINQTEEALREYSRLIDDMVLEKYRIFEQLNAMQSLHEIGNWMKQFAEQIIDSLEDVRITYKKKLVHDIQLYIQNNYDKHLMLEDLAKQFNISSAYLSSIFSKTYGRTLVEYLTAVRIDKAKELLRQGTKKIDDIGKSVSYDNHRYFSQVFKKQVGLTPSEYRIEHLTEDK